MSTRMNVCEAEYTLELCGIDRGADYYTLRSSTVAALVDCARSAGYRKPVNANGSTGRYFHEYLQRIVARGH